MYGKCARLKQSWFCICLLQCSWMCLKCTRLTKCWLFKNKKRNSNLKTKIPIGYYCKIIPRSMQELKGPHSLQQDMLVCGCEGSGHIQWTQGRRHIAPPPGGAHMSKSFTTEKSNSRPLPRWRQATPLVRWRRASPLPVLFYSYGGLAESVQIQQYLRRQYEADIKVS